MASNQTTFIIASSNGYPSLLLPNNHIFYNNLCKFQLNVRPFLGIRMCRDGFMNTNHQNQFSYFEKSSQTSKTYKIRNRKQLNWQLCSSSTIQYYYLTVPVSKASSKVSQIFDKRNYSL